MHQKQNSGINSRLHLETVNKKILMLTTVIPYIGMYLYRTSYAVRSAVTATVELLVSIRHRYCQSPKPRTQWHILIAHSVSQRLRNGDL